MASPGGWLRICGIRINGTTVDAIIEKCRIANSEWGIEIGGDTHGVLLRKNTFENVENSIYGEGIDRAILK